jgi:tRNA pseudouridine32 synthase / 23S rRNA pseudouridine746 synthase
MNAFEATSRRTDCKENGRDESALMSKLSGDDGPMAELALVHADPSLLVFDKPAGLLSVPGRGPHKQDCLASRAQAVWPDALVVHRLDQATSGLLLMARGAAMQRHLSGAFAGREVSKRYVAVVAGRIDMATEAIDGWSVIDLPIAADWPNRPRRIVDARLGKPSVTRWRPLSHDAKLGSTRIELEPVTGRTHQLRVHLQAIGHPILGDTLYAPADITQGAARLLLHATRLELRHPLTGESLVLDSLPPF